MCEPASTAALVTAAAEAAPTVATVAPVAMEVAPVAMTELAPLATEGAAVAAETPVTTAIENVANADAATMAGQDGVANSFTQVTPGYDQMATQTVANPVGSAAMPSPGGPAPGIADKFGEMATKFGKEAWGTMTDPKMLMSAGMQGAGAMMQAGAIDAEEQRLRKKNEETMRMIGEEGDKMTGAVNDWAAEYMSPAGMQAENDRSEASLNKSLSDMLGSANTNDTTGVGYMPKEYGDIRARDALSSSQSAADYAKKMAAAQAPAFANMSANLAGSKAQQAMMNGTSRMNGIGAIGRAEQSPSPNPAGMIGGSIVSGLGGAIGKRTT